MLRRPFLTLTLTTTLAALAPAGPLSGQEPNFGRALAMTGPELFVGQPVNWYGPGVVYAYRQGADGQWTRQAALTAPDSSRMDDFGRALAVDGNTLVVGAPRKRDGAGVAYAFIRGSADAEWQTAGVVEPPRADVHREFASALALFGDDLLVGSPAARATGVVYHFARSGQGWSLAGVIEPGEGDAGDGFGASLGWRGDDLIVGAPGADSTRGRVYTVRRNADGNWARPAAVDLSGASLSPRSAAGTAVVMTPERAFAGAPGAGVVVALERRTDGSWEVVEDLLEMARAEGVDVRVGLRCVDRSKRLRSVGGCPGTRSREGGRISLRHRRRVGVDRGLPPRADRSRLVAAEVRILRGHVGAGRRRRHALQRLRRRPSDGPHAVRK